MRGMLKVRLAPIYWAWLKRKREWQERLDLSWLEWRNRFARSRVTGHAEAVVSMTTWGERIDRVHLTIESIARGRTRPARFTLWLDDERRFNDLPTSLRRLQRRGLELRLCENFGPHTKYYPHVESGQDEHLPLVTADDDVIYPPRWLKDLVQAQLGSPETIFCHRARTLLLDEDRIAPYIEWPYCETTVASRRNFLTGVSGVIYPAAFLRVLRANGRAFLNCCRKADDIWLNVWALRAGYPVRQLRAEAMDFPSIPDSDRQGLFRANQLSGGNDEQMRQTYSVADLRQLIQR